MWIIASLFGISAMTLTLGLFKYKQKKEDAFGIERVLEYTNDFVVGEKENKKNHILTRQDSKYNKLLGKSRTDANSLQALKADLPLTGDEWLVVKLTFPFVMSIFLGLLTTNIVLAVFGFFLTHVLLKVFVTSRIKKRTKAFNNQLNDALAIMSNSLRAGYSFLQSVNSVSREMPDPIAHEFRRVLKEMSLGQETDIALKNLVSRVESEDLELIVRAILIQKETGGNLAEILDTISTTIRDRVKIQGEIKTLTAQGRLSGIVVGTMPLVLIGLMYLINPEYISVMFTHPIGKMLLFFAASSEVVGMLLIRKIVSIEI